MKIVWFSLLCIVFTNFCMEVEKVDKKEEWKKIQTWSDVAPFAGCFVAYTIASPNFDQQDCYQMGMSTDNLVNIGYILKTIYKWNFVNNGYCMQRLLKRDGQAKKVALIDSTINNSCLKMRYASSEEIEKMQEVITSAQAKLENTDPEDILGLLK